MTNPGFRRMSVSDKPSPCLTVWIPSLERQVANKCKKGLTSQYTLYTYLSKHVVVDDDDGAADDDDGGDDDDDDNDGDDTFQNLHHESTSTSEIKGNS